VALATRHGAHGARVPWRPRDRFAGALLFGWLCVRLSGVYLAMLSSSFAQIVWSIAQQWTRLPRLKRTHRRLAFRLARGPGRLLRIHARVCRRGSFFLIWSAQTPFGYALQACAIHRCGRRRWASMSVARSGLSRWPAPSRDWPAASTPFQGQHRAGHAGHSALNRRLADRAARRHQCARRAPRRGGRLYLAAGRASETHRILRSVFGATILLLVLAFR
jgi:hypothetical protein